MGTLKGLCLVQWLLVVLGGWSRVQDLGLTRPSGRSVHVATFHASAHEFWIHGGSHGDFSEELWAFDFDTGSWEKRQLNQAPTARGDHVAVWDPNGVLWIHGGYDGIHYLNDLWRYSASTWTNIMAPGPSARSQHVAVWDASNGAIWIHGGLFDCILNQDLWKFDTQQGTWSLLPNSQHQPFARANHVAVWDEVGRGIWIHAGYNRSCGEVKGGLQQDLWRYDTVSSNWNLIAMGGPSARAFHVAGWDPTNRALWIHGGFDGGSFCRDLWRFDVENYAWQLIADKEGPSRRFNHAAAFDVTTMSLCVHGGYSDGFLQHDMWCYQWTTTTTSYTTSISSTSSISTSSTVTSTATSTTTFSRSSTSMTSTTSRSSSETTTSSLTLSTSVTSSSTVSHSSTSSSASTSTSTSTTLTLSITSTLSTSSSATRSTSSSTSTTTHSTSTSFSHTQTTSTSATSSSTSTSTKSFSSTTTSFSISFTSTSSTSTTSASKSSTSLTRSSSTSSTQTSSSSTQTTSSQTQTTSTSSTITMTTSTSSSMTTTTTTPEDLTAVYILCPLLGFAIVALIILSLLYMRRYCKLRRFVVLPVQPSVPYAYVKWPPSPPPPPIIQLPAINTQELIPPPGPFPPPVVPSNPDLPLLPELCSSEAVHRPIEICIAVPSEARDAWVGPICPMCVSPAPPIVEVGVVLPGCPERELKIRRLLGETQAAPQLPMILTSVKISKFVLRPIPHLLELCPTSRSDSQKVAQQVPVLALAMPDLYKCEPGEAGRGQPVRQLEPVKCTLRMSPAAIPSHLREGPSVFMRAKLGTLAKAIPRLPSEIQKPPVLPVRDHGAKVSRSKGVRMVLDEPGIVKRKRTKVCACEVSELTSICLHVSIPRVMQAFREPPQMLPSEPKKVIIRHKGVALSAPPKFQCPNTRKPRQPLRISPPPVLEEPARNPSALGPGHPAPVTSVPVYPDVQAVGSTVQAPGAGAEGAAETVPWWMKPPQRQRKPFRP